MLTPSSYQRGRRSGRCGVTTRPGHDASVVAMSHHSRTRTALFATTAFAACFVASPIASPFMAPATAATDLQRSGSSYDAQHAAPHQAQHEAHTGLRARLQADAAALLPQGAPGVLAGLQTGRSHLTVRAGVGDRATGAPVPPNAHFRIGSATKTFVATVALQLVAEHRLRLDDTVDHWLPGLVQGNGNDGRRITVRELLQHTSGLPDYLMGVPWVFNQAGFEAHRFDTMTATQAVQIAMQFPPNFAPGTSWSYSNTNYQLMGLIIEKVTGHDWRQEVRTRILTPLHLSETSLPGTDPDVPTPHAEGYERFPGPDATDTDPDYGDFIDATRENPSWGGAAGEMISTTRDLGTFLRALVRGRLLPPAQLREMETTVPVDADFNTNWPGARYGLGLMWIPTPCGGSWSHGGDIMGYRTRDAVTPDGSRSVVVSLNTDSMKPDPGVTPPADDVTNGLVDDALCG